MICNSLLQLLGRYKELINRGGEMLSPLAIEAALAEMDSTQALMVFAVPHTLLGETVGLAIVPRKGDIDQCRPTRLAEMRAWLLESGKLGQQALPECLVFLASLPRGGTGKVQRRGFAERLGLAPLRPTDRIRCWRANVGATIPVNTYQLEPLSDPEGPAEEMGTQSVDSLEWGPKLRKEALVAHLGDKVCICVRVYGGGMPNKVL
jgi:hypothetical protein